MVLLRVRRMPFPSTACPNDLSVCNLAKLREKAFHSGKFDSDMFTHPGLQRFLLFLPLVSEAPELSMPTVQIQAVLPTLSAGACSSTSVLLLSTTIFSPRTLRLERRAKVMAAKLEALDQLPNWFRLAPKLGTRNGGRTMNFHGSRWPWAGIRLCFPSRSCLHGQPRLEGAPSRGEGVRSTLLQSMFKCQAA